MPDEVLKYALCALFVFLIEEQKRKEGLRVRKTKERAYDVVMF